MYVGLESFSLVLVSLTAAISTFFSDSPDSQVSTFYICACLLTTILFTISEFANAY